MPATFIGVRHHSPACARLIQATIERERPAYVLVEGPADMNDRLGELLLDHQLPVAIFTSYRDAQRSHASWSPFCEYSPEWVALTTGRRVGAQLRFIDLPAWHPSLADRTNRYADAEQRYTHAIDRLCREFGVDNVDTLWDHLFEVEPREGLSERLITYFEILRGDASASHADAQREKHMAAWVRAATADAGPHLVLVVTGGFHRPALVRMSQTGESAGSWPTVPALPDGAVGGSYIIPFSFRRLDAFDGYQSGMPSPAYYQQLWEADAATAAAGLVESVVRRLRARKQPASTADLVAAHALSAGLARLRGHPAPSRVDVLDGLLAALVTTPLDIPPPWTGRGRLRAGTDPVVVEMIAALSGDRVGRLHPATPLPPLVHDVESELERFGIPEKGTFRADLTTEDGLGASRLLHRLRVLGVPGFDRDGGPSVKGDAVLLESWTIQPSELRLPALVEAGAYGLTLPAAAGAALEDRLSSAGTDTAQLGLVVFDAALCGLADLSDRVLEEAGRRIQATTDFAGLGVLLDVALGLWRHDRLLGAAGAASLATVISAATRRGLWLAEGIRGGPAPADLGRLATVVAIRDAVLHAEAVLDLRRDAVVEVFDRLALDQGVPPDLRGAAFGLGWALGRTADVEQALRGAARTDVLGDWLAGLFAVAREEVASASAAPGVVATLDELLGRMAEHDFLVALPALRQAFVFFPPRERESIAQSLLESRGMRGSARSLLRTSADPAVIAWARDVEGRVDEVVRREALIRESEG